MKTKITQIRHGAPTKVGNMGFISAIAKIAITGSAVHEYRHSEVMGTVKTLDQLTAALHITAALHSKAFYLRLSSIYLPLIPQNVRSIEGKRHVNTAPVKLLCSENFKHSSHVGAMFARSTIRHLEEVAGFFGSEEVAFRSQDDKTKVPIGLTAANKQAPLVMHVESQITKPFGRW